MLVEPVFGSTGTKAGSIPKHIADTNPQTSKHLLKRVQGDVLATNFEALEGGNGQSRFCSKLPQSLFASLLAKELPQLITERISHRENLSESVLHI